MGFPDDRASDFVFGFPTAVAPDYRNRSGLNTSPPLFILRMPESVDAARMDDVVTALRASLDDNGKLVHYARLPAADDSTLLSEIAGVELMTGAPEYMTPDRYPHFRVMRDLIAYIRRNPAAWREEAPHARKLRQYVSERRAQRGGLLGFTKIQGPGREGLWSFLGARLALVRAADAQVAVGTSDVPQGDERLAGRGESRRRRSEPFSRGSGSVPVSSRNRCSCRSRDRSHRIGAHICSRRT
jgi:hypothetical protein